MSLRALAQQPLLFLAQGTSNWLFYSRLFSEHHLSWMPEIEVAAAAQVLPVVKHELGIGFVPSFMAKDAIERGASLRCLKRCRSGKSVSSGTRAIQRVWLRRN